MESTARLRRVAAAGPADRVAALLVCASVIRYAGQLVLLVLIARFAGAQGVGTYTVALAVCAPVFIIAGFGIRTVRLTLRRPVPAASYERFLLTSLLCGTALVAIIAVFLPSPLGLVAVVIAVLRISETFLDLYGAMLQRAGRPRAIVAVMGAGVGLQVAGVAIVFALGGGLVLALLVSAGAHVLVLLAVTRPLALAPAAGDSAAAGEAASVVGTASAASAVESSGEVPLGDEVPPESSAGSWRVLAAAGLPTGIAIGMLTLLSTMPQYLLSWAGGVEDAGRFAVLLYTVVAVEVLLHGLAQSWIPQARTLHEQGRLSPAAVGRTALRWTVLTGVPGLAGLGAAALLLPVVLGPEFAVAGAHALPLAVAILLVPASFAADTAIVVRNRYVLSMSVSVTALVVGTVTGAILVGLGAFDLTGALWTFAVTMAVRALTGFAAVIADSPRRRVAVDPARVRALAERCWPVLPIAVAVTALVAAGPTWALGVTGAVLLLVVLTVLRVSVAVLLVMTVPLALYVEPGGMLLNLAVSDAFLLLLLIRVLIDPDCIRAAADVSGPVRAAFASFALFLAVACGTVVVRSAGGAQEDWVALVADAVKLLVVLGYFVICSIVFRDLLLRRDCRFLTAWAFTAAIVGALGTVGALLFERGVETGLTMDFRATGTFEDPNAFATYLILSLPLTLLARHLTGRSLLSWHLIPILAGIVASFSRGALVGIAGVLVLLCLLAFRDHALRALRIVAVLGVAATAVLVLDGAISTVFQGSRGVSFGEDVRFRLWEAAIDVFLHAPVTGVGLGQFITASRDLLGSAGGVLAHNTYLSVLAEGGLVGSALLLVLPIIAVVGLVRTGDTAAHLLLASGAGVALMAVSLNLQNFRPIWMLLALAVAWTVPAARAPRADDSLPAPLRLRAPQRVPSRLERSWN